MNIVLLGAQGAGKGVVSEYLAKKYDYCHISTGELFRKEIETNSELGKELASYINKGQLVPDKIVFKVIRNVVKGNSNFIFDGFPRNIEQAIELDKQTNIDLVIFVDAPKELLIKRLSARRHCSNCKKGYSALTYDSNTCSECGASLCQREDDVPEAINKRLEIFYQNIEPILNFYKQKNILKTLENFGELDETYKNLEKIIEEK